MKKIHGFRLGFRILFELESVQVEEILTNHSECNTKNCSYNRLWNSSKNSTKFPCRTPHTIWVLQHALLKIQKTINQKLLPQMLQAPEYFPIHCTTAYPSLSRTPYAKRTHQKQRKRAWKEQQFGSPYGFQLVWVQWVQHFHCHKITNTLVQIGLAK